MTEPTRRLGPVHLTVTDLDRQVRFYEDSIGMTLLRQEGDTVYLGADGHDLLALTARPGARRTPRTTGLYHFAILVPSRVALARSLRRIAETRTPVQGFADHFVSEAIYLADPEGNGIEIYRDLPRAAWPYVDGQLQMGTAALDIEDLLGELDGKDETWSGLHPDTTIGHVHLHVADTRAAEAFYGDLLGFDVMAHMPGASFLSMDGYHHHLGVNTWMGQGAPRPAPDSPGLRWYTLHLLDSDVLQAALARLEAAGIALDRQDSGALVHDPSGNGVMLTA